MRIFNLILLIVVFIFGIYQMKKASSIINVEWFKNLSRNEKIKITKYIKCNWKVSILLLSIIACEILVVISSFIGKTNNYQIVINTLIAITNIVVFIALIINNKNLTKKIESQR